MKKSLLYLDGCFVEASQGVLETFTPGQFNAKGVFETIRVDAQGAHFIDEHFARMALGLKVLGIKNPLAKKKWIAITQHLIKGNKIKLRLRWMVWQEGKVVHHALLALPYTPPTQTQQDKGLKVCLIKTDRVPTARLASVKSLDYSLFANAANEAKAKGFDDALLLNKRGNIFESTRANLFVLIKDDLLTPPLSSGCLNGVMRGQLINVGSGLNMPVKESNITPVMLKKAKAAFLTNSLMGLVPINLKTSKI